VKGEAKLRVNSTGCARSEGYYKIPMREKAQYLKSALRQLTVLKQRGVVDIKKASSQVMAPYLKFEDITIIFFVYIQGES